MINRLQQHPPAITIFDYGETDDIAIVDKGREPNIIFISRTLVESLENACASYEKHLLLHLLTTFYSWYPGGPFELRHLFMPIS
jgi:hypothetical protein